MGLFDSSFTAADSMRLARVERKLDAIMKALDIAESPSDEFADIAALARDPARKIEAIKMYRDRTRAGLAEAKAEIDRMASGG